ncbi:MAG: serine/threonine protein kinase, partial [Frankia sp.]|nr:serine/threonine protein kinase [Frankia sp.]
MLTPLGPNDRRTVGTYRLRGRLGSGGMGTVYLGVAVDERLVAVKVIRPDLLGEREFRERFRREVTAARRVRGTCVARVLDADPDADEPWMATEYVDGMSLLTAVSRHGRLHGPSLESLALGLAEGLIAVHAAGVVHRDLKPANILLSWEGPKIIDFGLARADDLSANTSGGNLIGTVAWMAPEQLNGDPATPASDVFNWGLCVAFAARGRHPFEAQTAAATAMRILSTQPALDGVPPALLPVVTAALDRDPTHRPTAVGLVSALTGQPLSTPAEASAVSRARLLANWVPPQASPASAEFSTAAGQPAPPGAAAWAAAGAGGAAAAGALAGAGGDDPQAALAAVNVPSPSSPHDAERLPALAAAAAGSGAGAGTGAGVAGGGRDDLVVVAAPSGGGGAGGVGGAPGGRPGGRRHLA